MTYVLYNQRYRSIKVPKTTPQSSAQFVVTEAGKVKHEWSSRRGSVIFTFMSSECLLYSITLEVVSSAAVSWSFSGGWVMGEGRWRMTDRYTSLVHAARFRDRTDSAILITTLLTYHCISIHVTARFAADLKDCQLENILWARTNEEDV